MWCKRSIHNKLIHLTSNSSARVAVVVHPCIEYLDHVFTLLPRKNITEENLRPNGVNSQKLVNLKFCVLCARMSPILHARRSVRCSCRIKHQAKQNSIGIKMMLRREKIVDSSNPQYLLVQILDHSVGPLPLPAPLGVRLTTYHRRPRTFTVSDSYSHVAGTSYLFHRARRHPRKQSSVARGALVLLTEDVVLVWSLPA